MYSRSNDDNYYSAEYCYDSGIRGADNVPFYPYLGGQPVVYYSHIAPHHLSQRSKITKKNNPNCFVKAFRWYTQELPSPQLVAPCNNANIGGFATWLDKKYDEYLQDSQCENNCLQYRSKQCSFTKSDGTINRIDYPTRKSRKFPRLKSPWKKKRRYINETERDAVCEKQSFEYILRPQDMSRPASECCQKASYCIRSDTTFITSKSALPTNMKRKSKSLICISKTKNEFEKDVMITNYHIGKCYKKQNNVERPRFTSNPTPIKANAKNINCDCYNTDLETEIDCDHVTATRNQSNSVNCQCATNNIPSETNTHNVSKKVSYSKLYENVQDVNRRNIKPQRSREETKTVAEHSRTSNQKLCRTLSNKSNTNDVICSCGQVEPKRLSSHDKVASKINRFKTVTCQCSMSNFLNEEARHKHNSNVSAVFKKISRCDLNRNECDDNKYIIQRQTSTEMTRVMTKCCEQTNKTIDCNSPSRGNYKDVICESYQYRRDINNSLNDYKVPTKVQTKTIICQCPESIIRTNNGRQQFEIKEQKICRKSIQENFHKTCCPCPKSPEPRLLQAPQNKCSSKNFNRMNLKCKEPFIVKELPVHGVQTSDHSIRFLEDSFLVKIV